jgi:tetratricopeptide (TPR) repeat protein
MAKKLVITSLPQAFESIKQMNLSGSEWESDYRVAGRRALQRILEGQMRDRIDRHLQEMARRGEADRRNVARSVNDLATFYQLQGKYAEAEPLHKRALKIWEKALGKDYPGVATDLNNLALVYQAQGRYSEAEPLYRRALAIDEKALGKDHPHVATSLNNLAVLYENQGRYTEAESLYKRSLEIVEKALV